MRWRAPWGTAAEGGGRSGERTGAASERAAADRMLKSGFLRCDRDFLACSGQFRAFVADCDLRELVEVFIGSRCVAGSFGGVRCAIERVEAVGRDFQHGLVFR